MSLVELARFSDSAAAYIAKGRLEAAGIPAFCFDTGMNLAEGVPMMFQVRVMVLDDDFATAQALLREEAAIGDEEPVSPWATPLDLSGLRRRRRRALGALLLFFAPVLVALLIVLFDRLS